ncbi:MAG: transcription termination factor Rho, partial [Verrucomicrobiota bacterium]
MSALPTPAKVPSLDRFPATVADVAGFSFSLQDLQALNHTTASALLERYQLRVRPDGTKRHLVFDLCRFLLSAGALVSAEGMIEDTGDHSMLRWPGYNFAAGPDDLFVSISFVREYGLQTGLRI